MNDLLKQVQDSIDGFTADLPSIEKRIYERLILLIKDLDIYADGSIKSSLKNIIAIGKIRKEIENIVLDKPYLKSVGDLLSSYTVIADIQDKYFSELTTEFSPKKVFDVVRKQAVEETANSLTESGVRANIVEPIKNIISLNVKSGGSYADLTKILRQTVLGDTQEDGIMQRYAGTYVVDATNTYARQYGQMISDDLGLDWYGFSGSLLTTSRPLCKKMHEVKYFHRSQFPELVKGIVNGEQTPLGKNGLPLGMKEGTTPDNYQTVCNGWRCNHILIAITKEQVPDTIRKEFE